MVIQFTANVTPHGKQRARTVTLKNGLHGSYTPQETVKFERAIAWAFKRVCKDARFDEDVPLGMDAWFYMPIPKSISKRQRERLNGQWHTKKPDGSNIQKSVEDALNSLAYHDDGQIAEGSFHKVYSDEPRVEVFIWQLKPRKITIIDERGFGYGDKDVG